MAITAAPLIDAEHAAFMQGGVSISAGSCGSGKLPSLARATGCRVDADRRRVSIYVAASHAVDLLADVRATGAIAVVFSQPSTNRTMQVKGRDAVVAALAAGELAVVEAYRDAFVHELAPLGYAPHLIYTVLACAPDDIVALRFSPCAAFTQTPGPQAGQPLKAGA